jgi:hypothetical protein
MARGFGIFDASAKSSTAPIVLPVAKAAQTFMLLGPLCCPSLKHVKLLLYKV